MKNKYFIISSVVVVLLVTIGFGIFKYNSLLNTKLYSEDLTKLGKELVVSVKQDDVRDYTFFEKNTYLELWDKNEREKMTKYMKSENLLIVPGEYSIKQGTKFEKAKEIIKLQKKESN